MKILRFFFFLIPVSLLAADPVSEMAEFSVFGKVDLAELAKGEIKTATGAPMSTARYLSVQSCFVIPKPPAQVMAAMKRFDPTAHRELKVYLHSDLPSSPSAANFAKLNNPPSNGAVKALAAATEKMSPELQLSQAEAKSYSSGQPVFAFWTQCPDQTRPGFCQRRRGRPGALRSQPATRSSPGKNFPGSLGNRARSIASLAVSSAAPVCSAAKARSSPISTGSCSRSRTKASSPSALPTTAPPPAAARRSPTAFIYASGGYNVALTLYQLWPVEIGGKPSTLVWRGDFISANSLGDLHGIERLASESAMRKDILKAATLFQRESSQ